MTTAVSVVIPCRNAQLYIAEALESVLRNGANDVEVIVIDDGSTDASREIVRAFGSEVLFEVNCKAGACAARNQGLRLASGSFVKFLDADDLLAKGVIEYQVQASRKLQSNVIVYSDVEEFNAGGRVTMIGHECPTSSIEDLIVHLLTHNIQTSSPLHRRKWLLRVGGFRESLRRGQEHDLHLRLAASGLRFRRLAGVGSRVRVHDSKQRISNINFSAFLPLDALEREKAKIASIEELTGSPLTRAMGQHFARVLWRCGRDVLRQGKRAEAVRYFQASKELSPSDCVVGSRAYRTLAGVCGPEVAEFVGTLPSRCVAGLSRRSDAHFSV